MVYDCEDYLEHYGIMGQKWHLRRFQLDDGTLTPEGRQRYLKNPNKIAKDLNKLDKQVRKSTSKAISRKDDADFSRRLGRTKLASKYDKSSAKAASKVNQIWNKIDSLTNYASMNDIKLNQQATLRRGGDLLDTMLYRTPNVVWGTKYSIQT